MADTTYEHELEAALLDVLCNTETVREMSADTGLEYDRCHEILKLKHLALDRYKKRNDV